MNRYRVTITLQSGTNAPVEIVYARNTDAMGATHAMTSAIVTHTAMTSAEDSAMPESIRTNLVSVRIETIN